MFNIESQESAFWKKYSLNDYSVTVWIKGYVYSHNIEDLVVELSKVSFDVITSFLNSLDGHFSIIVKRDDLTFICVDKIRSTPLYFTKIDCEFFIDYDPKKLIELPGFDKSIDEDVLLEIQMSGFSIGNKTIYKELNSLKAGEVVIFRNEVFEYIQYYKYFEMIADDKYDILLEKLYCTTIDVFKKMIANVGDRQIVVPLSAGNDSRLVCSVLKYLDVKNVLCYSYGTQNNFEANVARVISEKLGYDWVFIPLTHKSEGKFYSSKEYSDYLEYSQSFSSASYIQSLSTIKYLQELNLLNKDAVFVNGNSGDFISGAHITKLLKKKSVISNTAERKENILNTLVDKHFSLWGYLKTPENLNKIKSKLWDEIVVGCGELSNENSDSDHLFYEYSEFIDRQSSYVISGQKAYEFYGFEWRMPLWDQEYLDFFINVPAKYKVDQKLYVDMLKKYNIADVWGDDIPVNKKTITPKWVRPIRFLAKIPFVFLGKRKWKNFDLCLFYYWMDVTHMIDTSSYFRIIKDLPKKPRNHVSWQVEDYIEKIKNESTISK